MIDGDVIRLTGERTTLRTATPHDIAALARIRATPEVRARWRGGTDLERATADALDDDELAVLVIEDGIGRIIGQIQWSEEDDPDYHHASVDIFIDPVAHGRGFGGDAITTLCRYLIHERGIHRLVIDPAADNTAAIRCYTRVGFRPVGVMRRYERAENGTWHDGLLMDLLPDDLT